MFTFFRQLRARLKYRHFDRDLAREIDTHRAMKQRELETAGIPPAEARTAASRALGNVTLMREDARGIWIGRWLREARQDTRYALTAFRRQPGFSIGAVLMLGVGLGLVAIVFTYAHATILRPWRVPDPESLRFVRSAGKAGTDFRSVSMPEYRYLRDHARTIRHLAVTVRTGSADARFKNGSQSLRTMTVTANYFEGLGVALAAGRPFLQSEDTSAAPSNVVVISERVWAEQFNRDPSVAGQSFHLGRRVMTIVGVAPASFLDGHDSNTDLWRVMNLGEYPDPKHRDFPFALIGRLADSVSDERVTAELAQLSRQFRAAQGLPDISFRLVDTRPTSSGSSDLARVVGLVLLALVLVQVVACANVGNLLLARAMLRQREIAVRLSLGASRARLVRQLLTEAFVLASGAGVLAAIMVTAAPAIYVALNPGAHKAAFYAQTVETMAVASLMIVLTAVVCGLGPAMRATRVSLSVVSGERHGQTARAAKLSRVLLASQIALTTVLLLSAGLLTQGVRRASSVDPGFDIDAVQEVEIELTGANAPMRRMMLWKELMAAATAAGLSNLAASTSAPVEDDHYGDILRAEGTDTVRMVPAKNVTANYFDVLGIKLVAGRGPEPQTGDREVVLSQSLAAEFWPNESPLGKGLISGTRSDQSHRKVVVGVAPDLPVQSLNGVQPIAYAATEYGGLRVFLLRSTHASAVDQIRPLVEALEPGAIVTVRPLRDSLGDTLETARRGAWLAWGIAGIGLLLATVGAFGTFAHAVEQRRREIGIRMALGAEGPRVVRMVLQTAQWPLLLGLVLGAVLALGGTPLLQSRLYGLSPLDPFAFLQVAVILAAAAGLATWIPARRATRVNPAETLRAE